MSLLLAVWLQIALQYSALGGYSESASWFENLPQDERTSIQSDLLLAGYYNSLADGKFGPGTFKAITRFEMARGVMTEGVLADGVLDTDERDDLGIRASEIYGSLGFELVSDSEAETDLYLPKALLPVVSKTKRGKSYLAANGAIVVETIREPFSEEPFSDVYATLTDPAAGRTVTYSNYSPDRFVVSGMFRGKGFYMLFLRGNGHSVGFSVSWSKDQAETGSLVALYIASHFFPWEHRAPGSAPSLPALEALPSPDVDAPNEQETLTGEALGSFVIFEEDHSVIALSGDITNGSPLDLRRALKARPDARLLLLDSNGGFVDGALVLAHEIHDRGLDTYVPSGAVCLSACAYVFFAGIDRAADGELGVHQVWNDANDLIAGQAKLSDVLEAFREFGVPREVESIMLRTPPEQIYVFTAAEIVELGLSAGDPFTVVPEEPAEERLDVASVEADNAEAAVAAIDPGNLAGSQSLLLEASDDGSTGAVPFSGTVDWSKGTDETGLPTLIGKANIPARNLGVDVMIRKNSDPSLPASHLMEVNFRVSDGFIGGSVAGLPGVLLKNEELVQGAPLVGASARVVGNSFLFALRASPEDSAVNTNLLTTRKWMDLAIIYATGKRAIITLEKDASADAMFKEVFDAWAGIAAVTPEGTSSKLDRRLGQRAAEQAARNKAEEEEAARRKAEEELLLRQPLDLGLGD